MNVYVFSDGGSRGNPGVAGYGFVVFTGQADISKGEITFIGKPELLTSGKKFLGETTNNVAEWQGIIAGLEAVIANDLTGASVTMILDSLLVVNQMNGSWKVKQPHLKPLHATATALAKQCSSVLFHHVYRQFNADADALANQAMDEG